MARRVLLGPGGLGARRAASRPACGVEPRIDPRLRVVHSLSWLVLIEAMGLLIVSGRRAEGAPARVHSGRLMWGGIRPASVALPAGASGGLRATQGSRSTSLRLGSSPLRLGSSPLRLGSSPLRPGSSPLRLGSNALRLGSNALRLGSNALRLGSNALRLGSNAFRLGSNALRLGSNALRLGKQRPSTGEQRPSTGEQPPSTGEQRPSTGEQRPSTGEQPPSTGEQRPSTGEQRASTGEQRPSTGEQRPSTGEQRPSTGERRPSTGEQRPSTGGATPFDWGATPFDWGARRVGGLPQKVIRRSIWVGVRSAPRKDLLRWGASRGAHEIDTPTKKVEPEVRHFGCLRTLQMRRAKRASRWPGGWPGPAHKDPPLWTAPPEPAVGRPGAVTPVLRPLLSQGVNGRL